MKFIKSLHIILITVLLTTLSYSCTEEVDLKLNDSYPRLVVEGSVVTDSIYQYIKLSKTGSYLGDVKLQPVTGATVRIKNDGDTYVYTEQAANPGTYISKKKFSGICGKTYSLTINNVDINNDGNTEIYHASEKMKNFLFVDSLRYEHTEYNGRSLYKIYGYTHEPATVGDFYMFRYFINGNIVTDTLDEIRFYSDEFVNGNYLYNIYLGSVFAEKGDTLTIETSSITADYYNFVISFFLETKWSTAPFAGHPANIETNIDNGAVGYFNTEARTRFSIVFE